MPHCKNALMNAGIFPIRNHYYEPQFDNRNPKPEFSQDRTLPGINWNIPEQLEMLERFSFSQELADADITQEKTDDLKFYLNNYAEKLKSIAPFLTREREPCLFYIQKIA